MDSSAAATFLTGVELALGVVLIVPVPAGPSVLLFSSFALELGAVTASSWVTGASVVAGVSVVAGAELVTAL